MGCLVYGCSRDCEKVEKGEEGKEEEKEEEKADCKWNELRSCFGGTRGRC